MRSDSPSPSWYEPADEWWEDDDHVPGPIAAEILTVTTEYGWWTAAVALDAEGMP